MHDRIMQICTYDLFQFAYIPSWYEQLYELSQLAAPEPWRFRQPTYETQNIETPILERYINQVFRKQAIDYSYAPEGQTGQIFYINQEFACFHTGLNTKDYKSIYMCFSRNKRLDSLRKWCFKGFTTEDSPWFKYVPLLPSRPTYAMRQWMTYYDPEWEIRVNASHILEDEENAARLPESIRSAWNLPLLLETAVELARRKAMTDWSLAVPQIFQSRVQYLLPIHLTNMERPDLAMALSIMEGYYIGHTCPRRPSEASAGVSAACGANGTPGAIGAHGAKPEMAYQNSRLLARPTAGWLAELVE